MGCVLCVQLNLCELMLAGSRLYFDFLHKNQFDRWRSFDGVHVVAKVRSLSRPTSVIILTATLYVCK